MSVVGSENDEDDEVLAFDVDRPFFPPPPAEDHSRRRATQENVIQRLQLEAQRRSAHYYLTEYLAIQTRLLSARAQVQGRSDEQLSNSRWIRKLVSDITTAPRGSRPDGVPEELANDVWALVVVRDQLVSDLTMLGHKLDEVSERFGRSATWSMVYPGTVLLVALLVPSASSTESRYRYLRGISWVFFGLCTSVSCFCGLRAVLVLWLRRLVDVSQRKVDNQPPLSDSGSVLSNLSHWGWSLLQFSMPEFLEGRFWT